MKVNVFDDNSCILGEGPLWHPLAKGLFWFDIINKKLFFRQPGAPKVQSWEFLEHVSAAGWLDKSSLLIASETRLFSFDFLTRGSKTLIELEVDNPKTRSNDGRVDPWGGFWIGTMGKKAEPKQGAIYRFYQGELRRLFSNITIPNAICFAHDGSCAYYTDSQTQIINKVLLDTKGWPRLSPQQFIDLRRYDQKPDGAVVDSQGKLFIALWGSGMIACYNAAGQYCDSFSLPTKNISCPAFGGDDYSWLFATSASQDLEHPADLTDAGKTFVALDNFSAQAEYQVKL